MIAGFGEYVSEERLYNRPPEFAKADLDQNTSILKIPFISVVSNRLLESGKVSRMKRWLTHSLIVVYLGALFSGVACHAVEFGTASHPIMYFFVWDMFCGWSAFSNRIQVVGEGESGAYYELSPGPWGELKPFGNLGRQHYDYMGYRSPRFALNCLKHTRHEPITRVFVIEETWDKKYNMPEDVWNRIYDEPKDLKKYYQVRHVVTPDGVILQTHPSWLSRQFAISLANNPRLQAESRRNKPFYAFGPNPRPRGTFTPGSFVDPALRQRVGSQLGE